MSYSDYETFMRVWDKEFNQYFKALKAIPSSLINEEELMDMPKPGHTYEVTRRVKVKSVLPDGSIYVEGSYQAVNQVGLKWVEVDPQEWPPRPGDEWECYGVKYICLRTVNGLELRAYNHSDSMQPVVTESQFDEFLKTHPVLTRRK